ncbi:hypothetical protein [Alkalimonas amylolytica]|uniref:hypothetical protein n=1 Tax=Alkalimonas amylolytica TaxID=152573 RepID=UPI0011147B4F|nr:hypothetical protein [Alkalimonas amylolytica]
MLNPPGHLAGLCHAAVMLHWQHSQWLPSWHSFCIHCQYRLKRTANPLSLPAFGALCTKAMQQGLMNY